MEDYIRRYLVTDKKVKRIYEIIVDHSPCVNYGRIKVYISRNCKLDVYDILSEIYKDNNDLASGAYDILKDKLQSALDKLKRDNPYTIQITNTNTAYLKDLYNAYIRNNIYSTSGNVFAVGNSNTRYTPILGIDRVIVNGPATIIFWRDGTKTVVKQQKDDKWDLEKAIAMCLVKKLLGNEGNYYNCIREAIEKVEEV